MKKILIAILMLISAITMSLAQDNKVDGKGLRKGEWFIMYKSELLFYDYMGKLLNLDKMLDNERETESIQQAKYFEKVEYKKGLKQGEFQVYSAQKNNNGKYPMIARGLYVNGQIIGDVSIINDLTQEIICIIKYSDGKINDQEITLNKLQNDQYRFNPGQYNKDMLDISNIQSIIKINSSVCTEQTGFNEEFKLSKFIRSEKGIVGYVYGNSQKKKIETGPCFEVAEYNFNLKLDGVVAIYEETNKAFDTTSNCYYRANFKNDVLNGKEYFYRSNGEVLCENNYINGLLSGVSRYYASNGKVVVEAHYNKGILNGNYIVYHVEELPHVFGRGPFCDNTLNKDAFDFAQSNWINEFYRTTIPLFKKQGYKFNVSGDYKFFEANYANGIMQGPFHYFHSNGKKLYEGNIENCEENEYTWFDMNGTQITNKQEESVEKYYIQWDMSYMNWQCTNPGCGKKEICPTPNNVKTNIPLPEHYWILETGLRPDNRCSKTIAYIDPVDWTVCNNINFRQCNKKMVRTDKGKPVIEKFSTSDLLTFHLVKGYDDRLQEFLLAFSGKTTNTLLDLTAKGLDDYMSPIYGKDWRSDIRLRYNLK